MDIRRRRIRVLVDAWSDIMRMNVKTREEAIDILKRVYEEANVEPIRGASNPPDLFDKEMISLYIIGKWGLGIDKELSPEFLNKIFWKEMLVERVINALNSVEDEESLYHRVPELREILDDNFVARTLRFAFTLYYFGFRDEEWFKSVLKKVYRVLSRFEEIVKHYRNVQKIHMESSAGLIYEVPFTTHVRVGLAIYGEKPLKNYPIDIKPALRLRARLISVKDVPENYPISYSGTFITRKKTKIGVVAFGYADGLMKSLSNKGFLIYKGKRVPILGNITMDMTIVDLNETDAKVGDWIEIVNEERSFTALAKDAGTIPYELMCNLSKRIERIVLKANK